MQQVCRNMFKVLWYYGILVLFVLIKQSIGTSYADIHKHEFCTIHGLANNLFYPPLVEFTLEINLSALDYNYELLRNLVICIETHGSSDCHVVSKSYMRFDGNYSDVSFGSNISVHVSIGLKSIDEKGELKIVGEYTEYDTIEEFSYTFQVRQSSLLGDLILEMSEHLGIPKSDSQNVMFIGDIIQEQHTNWLLSNNWNTLNIIKTSSLPDYDNICDRSMNGKLHCCKDQFSQQYFYRSCLNPSRLDVILISINDESTHGIISETALLDLIILSHVMVVFDCSQSYRDDEHCLKFIESIFNQWKITMEDFGPHFQTRMYSDSFQSTHTLVVLDARRISNMNLHHKLMISQPTKASDFISKAKFSFVYGMNMASLENVCFVDKTTIAVFRDSKSSQPIVTDRLRELLGKSYSGFYSANNNWNFVEYLVDTQSNDKMTFQKFRTRGIASVPPYSYSIFHAAQILMQLVRMASVDDDLQNFDKSIQHLLNGSISLIFPSIARNDYEWTHGLTSMVSQYLVNNTGIGGILPEIFFAEEIEKLLHLDDALSQDSSWLCFDNLVLIGALELSLPFLTSKSDANKFRDFAESIANVDVPKVDVATSNDPLKVTIFIRPQNRWLFNMKAILAMLHSTNLIDNEWLNTHVLHFELLPFVDQVRVMTETDVLITPHGAAITNLIFMKPHSSVIEIMTSPWYEIGYQPTALVFDIHYQAITQMDMSRSTDCMMFSDCLETPLLVQRRSLRCYGIRQCNTLVDLSNLEVAFWQASQSVRILKRNIYLQSKYCSFYDSDVSSSDWDNCIYKKAYETNLAL